MKKFFICSFIAALFSGFITSGSAQNLAVTTLGIDPSAGKVGQNANMSFNFVTGGAAVAAGLDVGVTVALHEMEFVLSGGNPQVTGDGAQYFNWSINPQGELVGLQNKQIPAPLNAQINVLVKYTVLSPESESNTTAGNGALVQLQPGGATNSNQADDEIQYYTWTDGFLPVSFGATSASFTAGKLKIEWETFWEKDNQTFVIEASKDGKDFTQLDEVATKAENGNSSTAIKYTYSKDWHEIAAKFGFSPVQMAIMALLLISVLISARRAKKGAMLFSLALLITVGVGCRKEKKELDGLGEYPTIFVRIGQTNKDGSATNYSSVVKVVAE